MLHWWKISPNVGVRSLIGKLLLLMLLEGGMFSRLLAFGSRMGGKPILIICPTTEASSLARMLMFWQQLLFSAHTGSLLAITWPEGLFIHMLQWKHPAGQSGWKQRGGKPKTREGEGVKRDFCSLTEPWVEEWAWDQEGRLEDGEPRFVEFIRICSAETLYFSQLGLYKQTWPLLSGAWEENRKVPSAVPPAGGHRPLSWREAQSV